MRTHTSIAVHAKPCLPSPTPPTKASGCWAAHQERQQCRRPSGWRSAYISMATPSITLAAPHLWRFWTAWRKTKPTTARGRCVGGVRLRIAVALAWPRAATQSLPRLGRAPPPDCLLAPPDRIPHNNIPSGVTRTPIGTSARPRIRCRSRELLNAEGALPVCSGQ